MGRLAERVYLEGEYPDTVLRVCVRVGDRRGNVDWRVWRDEFSGTHDPGTPAESPKAVGDAVHMYFTEF